MTRLTSPYLQVKIAAGAGFMFGVIVMFLGFGLARTPLALVGVVVAVVGMLVAGRNFARLVRAIAAEQVLLRGGGPGLDTGYQRANLPRKIFMLLYTVAEIDGRSSMREREIVRTFLLQRFLSPEILRDLASWNATPVPVEQLGSLVHELRAQLSFSECETLFFWCALITLIDERFSPTEHELLQRISGHFGIPKTHARRIFQHAKLRVMQGLGAGTDGRRFRGAGGAGGRRRPPRATPEQERRQAYEVLGLEPGASKDEIRRRHRELVKKYHPDAHRKLGPVAAEEATERFREVQRAYELLAG